MNFSYIVPWPDQLSAEQEFGFRLVKTAEQLGHKCSLITLDEIKRIAPSNRPNILGEFIFVPHFTIPAIDGILNIGLLWNSPSATHKYEFGLLNTLSWDLFVSGGSSIVDEYFQEIFPHKIIGEIFPSTSSIKLTSNSNQTNKMFYAGMNWERITGEPTRHGNLLTMLDRMNLIDIYGPKKLKGVEVWKDFNNYKGEIPLDGESVVKTANEYGTSLVLVNPDHQNWEMPSMRYSEAFEARNILIVNEAEILNFMNELVFQIPADMSLEQQISFIGKSLKWVRENPENAKERADEAARKWFDKYALKSQLERVIESIKVLNNKVNEPLNEKITILDAHSPDYLEKLYACSKNGGTDFIVHSQNSKEWLIKNYQYMQTFTSDTYFIGAVRTGEKSTERIVSGIERDGNMGVYFFAESLIINCKSLNQNLKGFSFLGTGSFFENLLIGHYGQGQNIGAVVTKSEDSWAYQLSVHITKHGNILRFGKIQDLTRSHNAKTRRDLHLINRYKRFIPMSLRNVLRPLLLAITKR